MTGSRSGHGPDDRDAASWATETLPLAVRKELLERELSKLGFHKAVPAGPRAGGSVQQQQQQQQQAAQAGDHPQADQAAGGHSA